jgi:hypothetical protein
VQASAAVRLGDSMLLCSAESAIHSAESAAELAYDEMPDTSQALLEQAMPLVLEADACELAPA